MAQILECVCPGVLWSCRPNLVKFGQTVSEKCYLVKMSRWQTSCGPKVGGDVISGGSIEVNKWGLHTKFRGSSSTGS